MNSLKEWNLYNLTGIHAHKLAGIVWATSEEEALDKFCTRWHVPEGVYARARDAAEKDAERA